MEAFKTNFGLIVITLLLVTALGYRGNQCFEQKELAYQFYQDVGGNPEEIDGINTWKKVKIVRLPVGKTLIQWEMYGRQGNYYGLPGSTPDELGINSKDRHLVYYRVTQPTEALFSTTSPVLDTWTDPENAKQTRGGGSQYFSTCKTCFKKIESP
ncbi:polymorphic toxin type 46 domain-containing protein [Desulfobacterales bacterium HSG17]|nr:polymorphic toxin type 46 domain-containing protein [Desulfobacterales bacterium HSG17]